MDDAKLQTIWQQRQLRDSTAHLGSQLAMLMKYTIAKKVKQLGRLAEVWDQVVPEEISMHTALESYNRGVLTVIVDSAPHRFSLQMLLAGGLQRILQTHFSGALNKVNLSPGQFHSVDLAGMPRYQL
jgi:hypothetical protein